MEAVAYYKEHGSKLTDAKGKGLWDKVPLTMKTVLSLKEKGLFPSDKAERKAILTKTLFNDLKSLTPESIKACRLEGVSLGSSLPDGTTLFSQKGRSIEQKKVWMQFAHISQANQEFQKALTHGNAQDADLLLSSSKVQVNVPDADGHTPLWHTIQRGQYKTMEKLISLGADMSVKDKQGASLFDSKAGRLACQMMLNQAVAKNDLNNIDAWLKRGATIASEELMKYAKTPEMVTVLRQKGAPYREAFQELDKKAHVLKSDVYHKNKAAWDEMASWNWKYQALKQFHDIDQGKEQSKQKIPASKLTAALQNGGR